nr:MAG TPA: hypothetical protein [Caudoviricetes sp.]
MNAIVKIVKKSKIINYLQKVKHLLNRFSMP